MEIIAVFSSINFETFLLSDNQNNFSQIALS